MQSDGRRPLKIDEIEMCLPERVGTDSELRQKLGEWVGFYNTRCHHSSQDLGKPDSAIWKRPRPGQPGPLRLTERSD